ncbi:hypothetical protein SDC9_146362 [bioreactor metagenome]|uniref:Shikimate kinase n=1 Tax=bioreactor metagenome TaxID=1076179 RepID=A0A645ECU7_9ZZZZ
MKIYIVGSVGSGKSTLARRASEKMNVPCFHLDEVVHVPDATASWGNRKRPVEERDALFREMLASSDYIMEDAGRECFLEGMRLADAVVLLDPTPLVRRKRILFRWVRQNLGLEKCIYRPRFVVLKSMFGWARNYEAGKDGMKARLAPFSDKLVVLRRNGDVRAWLDGLA